MSRRSPAFNDKAMRQLFQGPAPAPQGASGTGTIASAPDALGTQVGYGRDGGDGFGALDRMTVQGTIYKTTALIGILLLAAVVTWSLAVNGSGLAGPIMIGSAIGGLVVAMVTIFKPNLAPYTAPAYAVLEGLFLGGISAMYEQAFEGIVMQAVLGTAGVTLVMLQLYRTGTIKVTDKFRSVVMGATGAIFLMYMVSFVMSFFGSGLPFLHDSGPLGIVISLAIIVVAALNLLLDFDFIEKASAAGAPARTEWYAGFAILVTLVWLYLEMLRLLSKLRD